MEKVINKFDGEYEFLSNFAQCTVVYDGNIYPTVEHAYQAAKSLDKSIQKSFTTLPTPGKAKKLGKQIQLRPDWEQVKDNVMKALLKQKFSQEPFKSQLIATGNTKLVEGNTWNDTYWGVCGGKGLNMLGTLLMEVRSELIEEISNL